MTIPMISPRSGRAPHSDTSPTVRRKTDGSGDFEPVILHLTASLEVMAADRDTSFLTSYVYVIEAIGLGLFKIGKANDFATRFPSYRTECPVECRPVIAGVVPNEFVGQIERGLHRRYADKRKKGEWFALSEDDLARLAQSIREESRTAISRTRYAIKRNPILERVRPLDDDWLRRNAEIRQEQARSAVPTDELILDRIADAAAGPLRLCAQGLASDLKHHYFRSPHAVHEDLRTLIRAGEVAIVSPRRHPETGTFWFDAYRDCGLIIPDVTCTWERTYEGYEIQVSEPLGRTVPEFFGVSRW
jgi:hypothetical protein